MSGNKSIGVLDKTIQQYRLGETREVIDTNGWMDVYKYFKVVDDVDIAVGMDVQHTDTPGYVTPDRTGGSAILDGAVTAPAGVADAFTGTFDVSEDERFGWFLISKGSRVVLKTNADGDIAEGDFLMPDAAVDGSCNTMAAGSEQLSYASATADDAAVGGATVAAILERNLG
jgi:hypothetical protein